MGDPQITPMTQNAGAWLVGEGIHLDARRAVYLSGPSVLAVADLHLGYAWAQRRRGQLLPLGVEDTVPRLRALCEAWKPRTIVVLGDFVHAAAGVEGIRSAVTEVLRGVPEGVAWRIVLGNHDHRLEPWLREWGLPVPCGREWCVDGFQFIHGDVMPSASAPGAWTLSGHEHPCVVLGDGGTTSARVPAFLAGERQVVLPAFSSWAGGCVLGRQPLLGDWARGIVPRHVVACVGARVLPIPWERWVGRT